MPKTTPEQNKAIVLKAFDTLFNKGDYAAAERFWSPTYVQHSAHIAPGREGLFALVRATPDSLRYENQLIIAEGDYVIAHGRFTGIGKASGLDCGRRCPIRGRSPGRALGRVARRSHTERIREWSSHVW